MRGWGRRSGGWSLDGWHRFGKENRPARRAGRLGRSSRRRRGAGRGWTPKRTNESFASYFVFPWFSPVSFSCSFYFVMTALIPFYSSTTHQARSPWSPVSNPYSFTLLGKFLGWMGRLAVHRFTPPAVAASLAFWTSSGVARR